MDIMGSSGFLLTWFPGNAGNAPVYLSHTLGRAMRSSRKPRFTMPQAAVGALLGEFNSPVG